MKVPRKALAKRRSVGDGLAVLGPANPWLRGEAYLEGDWIVLDRTRAKEYLPLGGPDLLFDLADIHRPKDALPFVRKYGLLLHGPGEKNLRESFTEWENAARDVRGALWSCFLLGKAVTGDKDALDVLWKIQTSTESPMAIELFGDPASDSELFDSVASLIAASVNRGLRGVQLAIVAGTYDDGRAPEFFLSPFCQNLLNSAYRQLAALLVTRAPLEKCAEVECGRYFEVKDKRQQYCSPTCAGRARYRRWAEGQRQKGDNAGI